MRSGELLVSSFKILEQSGLGKGGYFTQGWARLENESRLAWECRVASFAVPPLSPQPPQRWCRCGIVASSILKALIWRQIAELQVATSTVQSEQLCLHWPVPRFSCCQARKDMQRYNSSPVSVAISMSRVILVHDTV